jgi:hypothetical protein
MAIVDAPMEMTVEDGQHLFNDWQQVTGKVTNSLGSRNQNDAELAASLGRSHVG